MSKVILVVDDEPDIQLLVRQNFRRKIRANEFVFHFAQNGFEALKTLETEPDISVILSDINMPEMDGLALLDKTKDLFPDVKTIVVSAYGDMDNVRTAMNNGAFDFVTKPVDFTDLEKTLDKTIEEVEFIKSARKNNNKLISMERDMEIGLKIQYTFLPESLPKVEGWDIAAKFYPAKVVSGDFYDAFLLEDGKCIALTIADVCDKGVGAALYMSLFRSLIRAYSEINVDASERALNTVKLTHNYIFTNHNESGMFATMFFAHLNLQTGELVYVNGGHNPPLILRSTGEIEYLQPTGPAVGVLPESQFKTGVVKIEPGDVFLSFTDGANEAVNPNGELFEMERIEETMKSSYSTADELLNNLEKSIREFMNGAQQADDITLLAVKYK